MPRTTSTIWSSAAAGGLMTTSTPSPRTLSSESVTSAATSTSASCSRDRPVISQSIHTSRSLRSVMGANPRRQVRARCPSSADYGKLGRRDYLLGIGGALQGACWEHHLRGTDRAMGRHEEQRRRDERRGTALRDDHGIEVIGHRHLARAARRRGRDPLRGAGPVRPADQLAERGGAARGSRVPARHPDPGGHPAAAQPGDRRAAAARGRHRRLTARCGRCSADASAVPRRRPRQGSNLRPSA